MSPSTKWLAAGIFLLAALWLGWVPGPLEFHDRTTSLGPNRLEWTDHTARPPRRVECSVHFASLAHSPLGPLLNLTLNQTHLLLTKNTPTTVGLTVESQEHDAARGKSWPTAVDGTLDLTWDYYQHRLRARWNTVLVVDMPVPDGATDFHWSVATSLSGPPASAATIFFYRYVISTIWGAVRIAVTAIAAGLLIKGLIVLLTPWPWTPRRFKGEIDLARTVARRLRRGSESLVRAAGIVLEYLRRGKEIAAQFCRAVGSHSDDWEAAAQDLAGAAYRLLRPWVPVLFISTLILQILSPIYCDEYTYQSINARALFDRFTYSSFIPLCTAERSIPMPWGWFPGQFVWWLLYYPVVDARVFRLMGVGLYLLGLALVGYLAWRCGKGRFTRGQIYSGLLSLWSMATFPILSVSNRPEFMLTACIGWFCFAPVLVRHRSMNDRRAVGWLVAHALICSLFFSLHPKSILCAPLVIVSTTLLTARWGKWFCGACSLALVVLSVQTFALYSLSSACAESAAVAKINSGMYIIVNKETLRHGVSMLKSIIVNLKNSSFYLNQNLFCLSYPIDWLPKVSHVNAVENFTNGAIRLYAYGLCVGIVLLFVLACWHRRRLVLAKPLDLLLPGAAILGVIGLDGVQVVKHFYEGLLVFGVLSLVMLWLFLQLSNDRWVRAGGKLAGAGVIGLSLWSQAVLATRLEVPYWTGFAGRGVGLVNYDHRQVTSDIEAVLKQCHLENKRAQQHVAVDDLAYLFLKKTYQPLNASYLDWTTYVAGGDAAAHTLVYYKELKALGVTGVVQRCGFMDLNPTYTPYVRRSGLMCGIGEDEINRLAASDAT